MKMCRWHFYHVAQQNWFLQRYFNNHLANLVNIYKKKILFCSMLINFSKIPFNNSQVDESNGPPPAVLKPLAKALSRSKLTTRNSTRSLNIGFKNNLTEEHNHSYPKQSRKGKHSYEAINNIASASSSPKRRVTIDQGFE